MKLLGITLLLLGLAFSANAEQHDPNEEITVRLNQSTHFTFALPDGRNYLACYIFLPDAAGNSTNLFRSLAHSSANSSDSILSVENGRLTLEYVVEDLIPGGNMKKHSCLVQIDQAIEGDNGKWKAEILEDALTNNEYSQVVKVQVDGGWRVSPVECPCGQGPQVTNMYCTDPEPKNGGASCDCNATALLNADNCDGETATIEEDCQNAPCPTTAVTAGGLHAFLSGVVLTLSSIIMMTTII